MRIHLSPGGLMDKLKALTGYTGTKIQVEVSGHQMTLHSYWGGGSIDRYSCYDMSGNRLSIEVQTAPLPFWDKGPVAPYIPSPDRFLVNHSTFSGKDMGLHIYLHPLSVLVQALPLDKPEISQNELFILAVTQSYKSFARPEYFGKAGFKQAEIEEYKRILFEKGWLNKAGAITPTGRNVVEAHNLDQMFTWKYRKEEIIKTQEAQ